MVHAYWQHWKEHGNCHLHSAQWTAEVCRESELLLRSHITVFPLKQVPPLLVGVHSACMGAHIKYELLQDPLALLVALSHVEQRLSFWGRHSAGTQNHWRLTPAVLSGKWPSNTSVKSTTFEV